MDFRYNDDPEDLIRGIQDPDRRASLRKLLFELLLARQCLKRYRWGECSCSPKHCVTAKNIIVHVFHCPGDGFCDDPVCISAKQLISHLDMCNNDYCQLCLPIRRSNEPIISIPDDQRSHAVELLFETLSSYDVAGLENKIYETVDTLEDYYRVMAANRLDLETSDLLSQDLHG